MPKYYCDYCKTYLTHDTMSVRKSHLMGRNHIKYYCDYYEAKAKTTGKWKPNEIPYEVDLDYLTNSAPGNENSSKDNDDNDIFGDFNLPPPPVLPGMPNPPPAFLNRGDEQAKAVAKFELKRIQ